MFLLRDLAYLCFLGALAPWLCWKAITTKKYRADWGEQLFGFVPRRRGDRPCAWFHAVSVGEVNLLIPIVEAFERRFPDWDCVVSATTDAGLELARRRFSPRLVFRSPRDFSWAVRTATNRIRPTLLILAELEIWPNWIDAVKRTGAKVAIANGRLSERSEIGYKRLGFLLSSSFHQIDLVAAQTKSYAERFQSLGVPRGRVVVTGSVKFDGAVEDRENEGTRRLRFLTGWNSSDPVFVSGSTQKEDEAAALQAYLQARERFPNLKWVLAPRHSERFSEVARWLGAKQIEFIRRSELADGEAARIAPSVLLVDTIGELKSWWGMATVAFVGGSFGSRGGQNMIEPAAFGAAVCFGPNTSNFRDVVELLLENNAAQVVRTPAELTDFLVSCVSDPIRSHTLGAAAASICRSQRGAVDRTVEHLISLLRTGSNESQRYAA